MSGSMQAYSLNIKQYSTYCMQHDRIASQQDHFFLTSLTIQLKFTVWTVYLHYGNRLTCIFRWKSIFKLGEGLPFYITDTHFKKPNKNRRSKQTTLSCLNEPDHKNIAFSRIIKWETRTP